MSIRVAGETATLWRNSLKEDFGGDVQPRRKNSAGEQGGICPISQLKIHMIHLDTKGSMSFSQQGKGLINLN